MTDASGTSRYYYDIQGRLIRYVPPTKDQEEYVIAYTYNNLGEKTSVRIGPPEPEDGNNFYYWYFGVPYVLPLDEQNIVYEASYEYYPNGWLKKVKSGAATIAEYSYDAVGNRMQQTNGNGTSTEYAFDSDPRYRVTSVIHKHGANVLAQIGYSSRDKVGNPESMTDWTGTWGYDYDSNNRLTGATPPNPVPGQPAGGPYEYDWVGNRLHPPADPNPMVYNDGDQLVRWPGMYRYSYDGAGNLVEVKNDSQTQVLKSYTYTPAGLLAAATFRDKDGNTRTLTNTWDADSNRISFDANGTEYELAYDPTAGIPAVIEETTPNATNYYIREPGGSLIARFEQFDGMRYYHFDELGSTRLLTDATGNVTDRYTYDAYGSLLSHDRYSGSVQQPYQYVGRLGYYTYYMEPDFGLLQLGVRFYDPEVGRFGQRDAGKQGTNDYLYSGDRPTIAVDPSGLAYMIFDKSEQQLCLYHDSGEEWHCCYAESGPGSVSNTPPLPDGIYRVDPRNITDNGCLMRCCMLESWGYQRCKIDCADGNYRGFYIHGGCKGRGTQGCIRIPDVVTKAYVPPTCCWGPGACPVVVTERLECLKELLCILSDIGTPIRLTVRE